MRGGGRQEGVGKRGVGGRRCWVGGLDPGLEAFHGGLRATLVQ
jgi:hypothetical protein